MAEVCSLDGPKAARPRLAPPRLTLPVDGRNKVAD